MKNVRKLVMLKIFDSKGTAQSKFLFRIPIFTLFKYLSSVSITSRKDLRKDLELPVGAVCHKEGFFENQYFFHLCQHRG